MTWPTPDLASLLAALEPQAGLAQRHVWLIDLLDWVRGTRDSVPGATARVQMFLDAVEARPDVQLKLQAWWVALVDSVDVTTLLADFGFARGTALLDEAAERIRNKLLPRSPETIDASELFVLALPSTFDAQWLYALDEATMNRLSALLTPQSPQGASRWQHALLDAITYCAGQILSTGFAPGLRLRMSESAREAQPFHALIRDVESLRVEVLHALRTPDRLLEAAQRLRERLEACRAAAATVYTHFEDNGISVDLVFRLRQLRARILRVRELLDCLLSLQPAATAAHLLAHLVEVGQERRSLRALLASNSSLLAAKVAERSAETGEHYITRTAAEYRSMVKKAAGGGAVMAITTLVKLGLYALALSAFWSGFWAGVNYAVSFVLVQLLHFTVATKQPAMTAPAMVAKLKELDSRASVLRFVDEVAHLFRSQVAAIAGNLLLVAPTVLLISALLWAATGSPMLNVSEAQHVLEAHHLLGPTLLFAAGTGVLLFASSIVAGWVENAFVLHKLDTAIEYNPHLSRRLGTARARRWARFLRQHISGLAANVSLGLLLGLVPAVAGFFGLASEVRHVTLVMGQMAAAVATLGLGVLAEWGFWSAVGATLLVGPVNLAVSFYLAFRLALKAQGVSDVNRQRIAAAIRHRWRRAPASFLWPVSPRETEDVDASADIPNADDGAPRG